MDKNILVQYCDMKKEIKDIRDRIRKLDKFLENPPVVSDTVRGSRKDGTIGPIKITGIPEPAYARKIKLRGRYQQILEKMTEPGIYIKDVIEELGFDSQVYFSRYCKHHFGCTPSQLMKRCQADNEAIRHTKS